MTLVIGHGKSLNGLSDFLGRVIIVTLAALAIGWMLSACAGCTYTRIGVDHETGNRNVFTLGLPTQIEGNGIKADNRINIFEGLNFKK